MPTGEAYSVLTEKGALLDLQPSKTIVDAMQLVRGLGLRYLWVDAFCIKQDDFSDKEEQIARMGFVFQVRYSRSSPPLGVTAMQDCPGSDQVHASNNSSSSRRVT